MHKRLAHRISSTKYKPLHNERACASRSPASETCRDCSKKSNRSHGSWAGAAHLDLIVSNRVSWSYCGQAGPWLLYWQKWDHSSSFAQFTHSGRCCSPMRYGRAFLSRISVYGILRAHHLSQCSRSRAKEVSLSSCQGESSGRPDTGHPRATPVVV